jgi:beta-glucosidase
MTLEEKVNQLLIPEDDAATVRKLYGRTSLGALYLPSSDVNASNDLQRFLITNSRLGLPVEWVQEALHGGAQGGAIFPMPLGMSATWNLGTRTRATCLRQLAINLSHTRSGREGA